MFDHLIFDAFSRFKCAMKAGRPARIQKLRSHTIYEQNIQIFCFFFSAIKIILLPAATV